MWPADLLALACFRVVSLVLLASSIGYGSSEPQPASQLPGHLALVSMPNPRITEQPMDSYFAKNLPATLDCKAEGEPTPTISWYQNDRKIVFDSITNYNDNTRMIVDQGRLFMLQFLHTKNRTYTGTYYCVATNSHGTAQSRTAFIDIAVIRDDFREEPVDKTVPLDSRTVLGCRPPRGEPEPIIDWLHDGKPVTKGDRISILGNGDLVFSNVNVDDGGEYICVASNIAGKKKSSPVTLTVLEVPEITRYPEPLTVDEGDTVEFHCAASGGGDVRVGWRREGGASRKNWRVLADHTLQISRVEVEDMGTYVCTAENGAGAVEAVAHLKVEYTPKILIRPSDQTAAVGRTISLPCSAIGNPKPTIYWETTAKTVTELMFEKNLYADGRMSVSLDGTLRMVEVARGDAGRYTCKAISSKGKAEAEATLTVQAGSDVIFPENDLRPPPIIRFGPQNQTLPRDGVAFLRCQATGTPQPTIHWLRNDLPLPTDARYMVLDSGTLQISSLVMGDTGRFSCVATSETGETTVDAFIQVARMVDEQVLKSPPDLTQLPPAPEKPVVSDVTNTSVRLSWLLVRITDNTPIMGYVVEYFEYGSSQSWQSADRLYVQKDVIITGLKPDTTYVFLVRAVNSYGTGGPSPLSDKIRTLEPNMGQPLVPEVNLPSSEIENRLRNVNVNLFWGKAINSSSIRLSWTVDNEYGVVTGFIIEFKEILNMGSGQPPEYGQAGGQRASYRPLSHTLTGLESYQYYEICVKATSGERTSPCSPPWLIQTGESVPSSPPGNVVVEREGDSVIIVTWAPPDRAHRHGKITGYKIKCMSVDEQQNCSRQVNGTTNRVRIDGLTAGVQYNIELAAETLEGVGSWSTVYAIGSGDSSVTKERWFIGSIGALGGVVWLGLCIFTCWLCRSRKRRKKLKEQWYSNGGQASNEKQRDRNGSVVRKGYGKKDDNNDSGFPAEFNQLLQQCQAGGSGEGEDPGDMYPPGRDGGAPEMKTFYQTSGPVTPYATTALLQAQAQSARKQGGDGIFRPGVCVQHSGGSADSHHTDRSITTDVSIELREGNKSSAGDSGHQSDENGMLIKQGRKGPGYRPGIGPGPGVVNWNEMLPPPPVHPPSDTEYNPDDALYSEIPEDRSRSPHLPAQNSSCSCPVSAHPQPVSAGPYPGSYSENCNRCQSLRNFDSRPYSPQQLIQLHRQHSQGCQPHHARAQTGSQRGPGGTPMYMHGYAQPWDSQPLPRGPYDYELAKVPQEGGYNYTQPIQDGLIKHSNTLNSRGGQGWRPHPGDGQLPYMGAPVCDSANIPGGPPGNYCEGPCRGQGDTLNSINSGYHRNLSDNGQLPYLEGYMIESPPSSGTGSDYRVCNSGGSQAGSGGDSGRSRSTGIQGQPAQYPHRMFQSGPVDEGFARNTDSPISEDPEACDTETESQRDSLVAHWESVGEGSDVHSSSEAEGSGEDGEGGNILTEEDFASAVARAAQLSGLTVVGSTVTDPNHNQKQVKKTRRQRQQARPPSPGYSTDSNYGTADIPHKPFPRSHRRKQLVETNKLRRKDDNSATPDSNMPSNDFDAASVPHPAPSSPDPLPSLYRPRPTETTPTNKPSPMFQFSDDIPVV
ncbi:roundabout homolog 2-like isoform X2 [Mya arenaria]|uniref:roundabout homolog 2-like isoform X2 n=1 Tax=Mya arenaria TaxID=6604 RepID=UPI0022E95A95|nr:roundabout homolog 2-like isoform X2 [Mya arenaria]